MPHPKIVRVALPVPVHGPLVQAIQIVHVDDLCNECGNCGFFCPYEGEPYAGKPTLFRDEAALRASANAGFAFVAAGPAGKPGARGAAGGTAAAGLSAEPNLVVRLSPGRDAAVATLPYADWRAQAGASPLLAVARTVFDAHSYLLPGGQA